MASRLKRTWNRVLRLLPHRKLLTPLPSETKNFFPGRDSLTMDARDAQHRRPLTAMATYSTPGTPPGDRSFLFGQQSSPPTSCISHGTSATSTRRLVLDAARHTIDTGSPARVRRRDVPSANTPFGNRRTGHNFNKGLSYPKATSGHGMSEYEPSVDDVAADLESHGSVAITSSSSSLDESEDQVCDSTPTTSPVAASERKSPAAFMDEKISLLLEPSAMPKRFPSPVMEATSGPLEDYYVFHEN